MWIAAVLLAAALRIFDLRRDVDFPYLTGEGDASEAAAMLVYGRDYLKIMLWGLIPFALSQVYGSTLRETGVSVLPMIASVASVVYESHTQLSA
jgi:Na+-driven multidrug efflux pump